MSRPDTPGFEGGVIQDLSKSVTISDEPEEITLPATDSNDAQSSPTLVAHSPKQHRVPNTHRKAVTRPTLTKSPSSRTLSQRNSFPNLDSPELTGNQTPSRDPGVLLAQVAEWLQNEKQKLSRDSPRGGQQTASSESVLSLENLEKILGNFSSASLAALARSHSSSSLRRRGSIAKAYVPDSVTGASSDTDFHEKDVLVPNVEADLDNTKTISITDSSSKEPPTGKDKENWVQFKQDIVRLTHTLKIKGWRQIPIENGEDIDVERLSGALTNAVYVVRPPKTLPEPPADDQGVKKSKRKPIHILLRIYGPQVGHLIDRDTELGILKRLARKKIGPRLLGTFHNGRFEEFFHAKTLTPEDIRIPGTSKQIAKRMRELHDGIDLLDSEREAGPAVFLNWDKWVDRCDKVISWLDKQLQKGPDGSEVARNERYTKNGLICGVEWPVFRKAYDRYREQLVKNFGGAKAINEKLVFAHNDTQYGNLMRLEPPGTSPLMQPLNQHKQLIVIDFEYASANLRGLEFANHFTEWCYNYHHPTANYACTTSSYPSKEEQYRFIKSYVLHRPEYAASASATPKMEAKEKTKIPEFILDARTPHGSTSSFASYAEEEKQREEAVEKEIETLMHETRLWRAANSAQWVAWGIVQAKVPELDEKKSIAAVVLGKLKGVLKPQSDPLDAEVSAIKKASKEDRPEGREKEEGHDEGSDGEEADEFDYLSYAHERAMFFWGDCLQMGIVEEKDLPDDLQKKVKVVRF